MIPGRLGGSTVIARKPRASGDDPVVAIWVGDLLV